MSPRMLRHEIGRAFLLVWMAMSGCYGDAGTADKRWPAAVKTLENLDSYYAYSLVDETPAGRFFYAEAGTRAQCGHSAEGWVARIETSGLDDGVYTVTTSGLLSSGARLARVTVASIVNGQEVVEYSALEGTVTLRGVPKSSVEWQEQREVAIGLRVFFPEAPVIGRGCADAASSSGEVRPTVCTCEEMDGSTTTCTPKEDEDCCILASKGRAVLQTQWLSRPCPSLCQWTGNLDPTRCLELL